MDIRGYLISTTVRHYQTCWEWQLRLSARQRTDALRAQHSPTVAVRNSRLSFSCYPTVQRQSPLMWLQHLASHKVAWVWTASQENWRNQAATECIKYQRLSLTYKVLTTTFLVSETSSLLLSIHLIPVSLSPAHIFIHLSHSLLCWLTTLIIYHPSLLHAYLFHKSFAP